MMTIITQQHGENIKVSAQTDIMTLTHHHINTDSVTPRQTDTVNTNIDTSRLAELRFYVPLHTK